MTSSDVIATCSAIVAALALIATFWQGWLAHRHNRLSVRPLLVWHVARSYSPNSARIAYSVKNLGLGSAIVRDRYFTKDEERFIAPDLKTDEVEAFLRHVLGQKFQYNMKNYGLPGRDAAIASQTEIVIADIEFPTLTASSLADVETIAGNIAFHVKYESMYKEPFQLTA
jgi:hypothetical protein